MIFYGFIKSCAANCYSSVTWKNSKSTKKEPIEGWKYLYMDGQDGQDWEKGRGAEGRRTGVESCVAKVIFGKQSGFVVNAVIAMRKAKPSAKSTGLDWFGQCRSGDWLGNSSENENRTIQCLKRRVKENTGGLKRLVCTVLLVASWDFIT